MNISKFTNCFKQLFISLSPTYLLAGIANYHENFQEYHRPWLSKSQWLAEYQPKY